MDDLIIPESVRCIGTDAFDKCGFLRAFFLGPAPDIEREDDFGIFGYRLDDFVVYCKEEYYDSFRNSECYDDSTGKWDGYTLDIFEP